MSLSQAQIAFDVTLTLGWRGYVTTGILRVETEIAAALLERNDPDLLFCRYRSRAGAFQRVAPDAVREALLHPRTKSADYRPAEAQTYRRRIWKNFERGWRRLFPLSELVQLGPSDAYISVGVWWGLREPDISDFERLTSQTRAVLMCHDVIPLLFPEYYQDPDVTPRFKRALPIFSNASAVVCNSHGTQQDLSQALIAAGLPVPQTRALQLPPGLSPSGPPSVISLNPKPERFVLAVGSISRRKNQAMLLDAWSRLAGDASLEDVKLIIVGGWDDNSASVRDRLRRDPELAGRVILMNNVTDGELASLYRNCLFTVYPSLYEGWGLPIGESLSFGKLCVASSGRAMEEAGGSLCLHLNPIDIDQWERTIRTLLADPAQRAEREIKIKASYKATDWKSVSDTIFDIARSSPPRPEG